MSCYRSGSDIPCEWDICHAMPETQQVSWKAMELSKPEEVAKLYVHCYDIGE